MSICVFWGPKLIFQLISILKGISFQKNSGSNFSVHPKGPKSKMAAKMAAEAQYFDISAPIHCRTKVFGAILCIFAQLNQHNQNESDTNTSF